MTAVFVEKLKGMTSEQEAVHEQGIGELKDMISEQEAVHEQGLQRKRIYTCPALLANIYLGSRDKRGTQQQDALARNQCFRRIVAAVGNPSCQQQHSRATEGNASWVASSRAAWAFEPRCRRALPESPPLQVQHKATEN